MQTKYDDWFNTRPQDIQPKVQPLPNGEVPKLRIACVAIGEVGHLIPVSHIADALVQRGHEVHFVTNSDNFIREKAKIILHPIGVHVHFTDDNVDRATILQGQMHKFYEFPHCKIQHDWAPTVFDVVQKINPDIVVSDFWCMGGTKSADLLNIPSVINLPAPFAMPEQMGILNLMNMKAAYNCCGMVFFERWLSQAACWGLGSLQWNGSQALKDYNRAFSSRVVLSNSFFGLEEPRCLPPNVYLTGPLVKSQDNLLNQLKEKDLKLYNWLDEAQAMKMPVVYISIGSLCVWQQWSIDALYYGLRKLGCRVVWSMKKEFQIPVQNDPDFWVQPWVPQVELLSHPAVKAGLSHCGWGGTMEFIAAGVPVVGWPHFFDQFQNAALICDQNKAGKILLSRMRFSTDNREQISYVKPEFDAEHVYSTFQEVLIDRHDFYKNNMVRLQRISKKQKGRETAVQVVEQTAIYGSKHLVDDVLQDHRDSQSIFGSLFITLFLAILIAGNLFFGLAYYNRTYSDVQSSFDDVWAQIQQFCPNLSFQIN